MGNHISQPTIPIDKLLLTELPEFKFEKRLGSTRFLKTVRGTTENSVPSVAKIFIKPESGLDVSSHIQDAQNEAEKLLGCGFVSGYTQIIETDRICVLVRPYFYSSLYDRISTQPFLTSLDRKWLAYQIISAVCNIHERGICHGDIKSENIMVTSWMGVHLTDFASYKPASIPFDNPSDFVYFFDSSSRRTCYLAPERFQINSNSIPKLQISSFSFSASYVASFCVPGPYQTKVLDKQMDIFSLGCILAELFLDGYPIFTLSSLVEYIKHEYNPIQILDSIDDPDVIKMIASMITLSPEKRPSAKQLLESKIFPDYFQELKLFAKSFPNWTSFEPCPGTSPFTPCDYRMIYLSQSSFQQEAYPILLSFVHSLIRGLSYPCTQIQAIQYLNKLSIYVSDQQSLNIILPNLCWMINNCTAPLVQSEALTALSNLMPKIREILTEDINLFPEFLFPILKQIFKNSSVLVRATCAKCIMNFADSCIYFVEKSQILIENEQQKSGALYPTLESRIQQTQKAFFSFCKKLLSDSSVFVKKQVLYQSARMCLFFKQDGAKEVIFSHVLTYVNEPSLKCDFFRCVPELASLIDPVSVQEYLVPVLLHSLENKNELVLRYTLLSISNVLSCKMELRHLRRILESCSKFMVHYSFMVRKEAVFCCSLIAKLLEKTDLLTLFFPITKKYLRYCTENTDKDHLMDLLIKPNPPEFIERKKEPEFNTEIKLYTAQIEPKQYYFKNTSIHDTWFNTTKNTFVQLYLDGKSRNMFPHEKPQPLKEFNPDGTVLAFLSDHEAKVNKLATSRDGFVFFSCSDDSTVKIWRLSSIQENGNTNCIINHRMQSKVKCVVGISSAQFACSNNKGNVQICSFDMSTRAASVLLDFELNSGFVTSMYPYHSDYESVLVIACSSCELMFLNLATYESCTIECVAAYGTIMCLLPDTFFRWLLCGTSFGVLSLYDVRLRIRLSEWTHYSRCPIEALCCHPTIPDCAIVACGVDVSVWNVYSQTCFLVYTTNPQLDYYKLSTPKPKDFIQLSSLAFQSFKTHGKIRSMSSPVGSNFVLFSYGNELRFWNLDTLQLSLTKNKQTLSKINDTIVVYEPESKTQGLITDIVVLRPTRFVVSKESKVILYK